MKNLESIIFIIIINIIMIIVIILEQNRHERKMKQLFEKKLKLHEKKYGEVNYEKT